MTVAYGVKASVADPDPGQIKWTFINELCAEKLGGKGIAYT
jgi:hypothetical protein